MNKPLYIAIESKSYDEGAYGRGITMEEALSNLESQVGDVDKDDVQFYEVTPIEVEFKIVKKEVVSKITKVKEECK